MNIAIRIFDYIPLCGRNGQIICSTQKNSKRADDNKYGSVIFRLNCGFGFTNLNFFVSLVLLGFVPIDKHL